MEIGKETSGSQKKQKITEYPSWYLTTIQYAQVPQKETKAHPEKEGQKTETGKKNIWKIEDLSAPNEDIIW